MKIEKHELQYLNRCVELAREALQNGDQPFGSVLVSSENKLLAQERNRINSGDPTWHPELALVRWAVENLNETERRQSTVYTSGEHCPMCAAAHAWAGMGRIVYACSTEQFEKWCAEWQIPATPVKLLGIGEIAPTIEAIGPVPEVAEQIRELHRSYFGLEPV